VVDVTKKPKKQQRGSSSTSSSGSSDDSDATQKQPSAGGLLESSTSSSGGGSRSRKQKQQQQKQQQKQQQEWEQVSSDQQESGQISMPDSVSIFDEIQYESGDGQVWKAPSKAKKAPTAASKQQQQQQWKKQKLQPKYAADHPQAARKAVQQAVQQQRAVPQRQAVQRQYTGQQQYRLSTSNMRRAGSDSNSKARYNSHDSYDDQEDAYVAVSSSHDSSSSSSVGIATLSPTMLPNPAAAGKALLKMVLLLPKMELSMLSRAGRFALNKVGSKVSACGWFGYQSLAHRPLLCCQHVELCAL
jgi:hypothetical protein